MMDNQTVQKKPALSPVPVFPSRLSLDSNTAIAILFPLADDIASSSVSKRSLDVGPSPSRPLSSSNGNNPCVASNWSLDVATSSWRAPS